MSRIMIGSISFDVVKKEGSKLLIGWFENTVYKTRWVSFRASGSVSSMIKVA